MKLKTYFYFIVFFLAINFQWAGSASAQKLSCGYEFTFFICNDSSIWAYGNNVYGQLGVGYWGTLELNPVRVLGLTNMISVSSGYEFSLGLKSDGTVWAWGDNQYGQLGDGSTTYKVTPVQVLNLNNVIEISAGEEHSLALKSDGTVWAWGKNGGYSDDWGLLGDSTLTDSSIPIQVHGPGNVGYLDGITAIAAGGRHSMALKNDSTVWTWGDNVWGKLGDGTFTTRWTPVQVHGPGNIGFLNNIVAISSSESAGHSLALRNDGLVLAWGENGEGQLGNHSNATSSTPVFVDTTGNGGGFIRISCGVFHSMAIRSDGSVWNWGYNVLGQLGDSTNLNKDIPVQARATYTDGMVEVDGGNFFSMGLKNDGTIWGWGNNSAGQLGTGNYTSAIIPIQSKDCGAVGINDFYYSSSISIYPNPAHENFSVQLLDNITHAKLTVYNLVGEIVLQTLLDNTENEIDLMQKPPGVYLLRIENDLFRSHYFMVLQ